MVNIPEKSDFCIYCYDFDAQGAPINAKAASHSDDSELTWWHLDALKAETPDFLQKDIGLSPLIVNALLAEDTRPRIQEFENGLLIILRGVNTNENARPEDMIALRIWIEDDKIITIRRRPLKTARDLAERAELKQFQAQKSGDILSFIISRLLFHTVPVVSDFEDKCDDLEELVIEDPDKSLRKTITSLRKQAILMRRYLAPQREVLTMLRMAENEFFTNHHSKEFQEYTNSFTRLVEDLDMMRERSQIIQDELTTALADQLNRNMYLLSVIAAIFLPLGFLTGLLGINVGGIPGADNDQAFWYFCGGLSILIILQIILFRKAKWF